MRVSVTSDRPDTLRRAVRYTALFADSNDEATAITVMALYSDHETHETRRRFVELRESLIEDLGHMIEAKRRHGKPIEQILSEVEAHAYDLVVLGIHLRWRLTQLRPKYIARHLARRIKVPVLIVFPAWDRLQRVLACTGAEPEDLRIVRAAGRMAAAAGGEVTVLHVMSQLPISADAQTEDLTRTAEELMERGTREGEHLCQALDILDRAGIPSDRRQVKVRHGLVVDEIIEESEEGHYDLVVVGAPYVSSKRAWDELRELIQENVAERVLMGAARPVLVVKASDEGEGGARTDGRQGGNEG